MALYDKAYIVHYPEGDSSLERNIPVVNHSSSDIIHVVKEGETLQNIAFRYWKDSSKWYIIAEANNIMNPFTELVTNMHLKIPAHGLTE